MLTLDKIYHAKFVLKDVARKTDLIAAPRLSDKTELYLAQTAEKLGLTQGQVKVRLHRCRERLRKYLRSQEFDL